MYGLDQFLNSSVPLLISVTGSNWFKGWLLETVSCRKESDSKPQPSTSIFSRSLPIFKKVSKRVKQLMLWEVGCGWISRSALLGSTRPPSSCSAVSSEAQCNGALWDVPCYNNRSVRIKELPYHCVKVPTRYSGSSQETECCWRLRGRHFSGPSGQCLSRSACSQPFLVYIASWTWD